MNRLKNWRKPFWRNFQKKLSFSINSRVLEYTKCTDLYRSPRNERIQVNRSKISKKRNASKYYIGHLGIEKCRQRASQIMYWPGMTQSIEETVKSCSECLQNRPKQTAEPWLPHQTANYPWEKIGVDLYVCNNKNYLLMMLRKEMGDCDVMLIKD